MSKDIYSGSISFSCSLCEGDFRKIEFTLRSQDQMGNATDSGRRGKQEYSVFITADKPEQDIFIYLMQRHNNHFHGGILFDANNVVDMRN